MTAMTAMTAMSLAPGGLAGCSERRAPGGPRPPARKVVLATSIDAFLLEPIVRAFEERALASARASGAAPIRIELVTDTEATKAMGLVQRLIAEQDRPATDVWWSGEVLGTVTLARAGLLQSWSPVESAKIHPQGVWPASLRDAQSRWFGHAQRARVIAFNPARVASPPRSLGSLLASGLRVGIAQPQFGSTRSHIAGLLSMDASGTRDWLAALAKSARRYPGNSAVVRAIATGEIDAGLTDSDDVWVGRRQGWDLGVSFATATLGEGPERAFLFPATVAMLANAPHPQEAHMLAEFLLSQDVERILAASESRNYPTLDAFREELAKDTPELRLPLPRADIAWSDIESVVDETDKLIAELMPL